MLEFGGGSILTLLVGTIVIVKHQVTDSVSDPMRYLSLGPRRVLGMVIALVSLGVSCVSLAAEGPATTSSATAAAPRVVWRTSIGKASDTPAAADGKRIVAASQGGKLVACSPADGKTMWTIEPKSRPSSMPLLTDTAIYLGHADGLVGAFDAATGKALWTFETHQQVVGRPALAGDRLLVGSYDTHLYCLSADTGKELWSFQTTAQVHAAPLVASDLVIIGGCDGQLHACH